MSSYDSTKSGYLHPQYQQQPPPYPTTPGTMPQPQQSPFYPPQPLQQQQPQQQYFSSSPTSHAPIPHPRTRRSSSYSQYRRPSYEHPHLSYDQAPAPHPPSSLAIPIRPSNTNAHPSYSSYPPYQYPSYASAPPPVFAQQAPVYTRSASHASQHMHDAHAYADGEDKFSQQQQQQYDGGYGRIDEETEREYEKRYKREREMERRPTLGDSLVSAMGKLGSALGGGGSKRR